MKMNDEPCRLCLAKSIPLNAKACQTAFLVNQLACSVPQFVARVRFPVEMLRLQVAKKIRQKPKKRKEKKT